MKDCISKSMLGNPCRCCAQRMEGARRASKSFEPGQRVVLGSGVLTEFRHRTGVVLDTRKDPAAPDDEVRVQVLDERPHWFYARDVYRMPESASEPGSPNAGIARCDFYLEDGRRCLLGANHAPLGTADGHSIGPREPGQ